MLLSQMLRLPLSLPGTFSQVLYPSYAKTHLTNAYSELSVENVMKRFLRGGQLSHQSETRQDSITNFESFTLDVVGNLVRNHIVSEQQSLRASRSTGALYPVPEVKARISEEVLMGRSSTDMGGDGRRQKDVEDFLSKDAVLSSAWTRFKGTHFTESNRFFIATVDLPPHEREGGGFLRKVITDAAIVRLLEVAGYVDFVGPRSTPSGSARTLADQFYESVPRGWVFPCLSFMDGRWHVATAHGSKRRNSDGMDTSSRNVRHRRDSATF